MKNLILGNGINFSEFPENNWLEFDKEVDKIFFKNILDLPNNPPCNFYKKTLNNFKHIFKKMSLENKMILLDIDALIDIYPSKQNIKYYKDTKYQIVKLGLVGDYAQKYSNEFQKYLELSASLLDSNNFEDISKILTNQRMLTISQQASFFYKNLKWIYIYSIKELLNKWTGSKKYSKEFCEYLKSFDLIFSFNVDGVINKKSLDNIIYPHGFFDKKRDIETNFEAAFNIYKDKLGVSEKDEKLVKEYLKAMDKFRAIPNKVIFSPESNEKKLHALINDYMENTPLNENYILKLFKNEINKYIKNPEMSISNIDGYDRLGEIHGDLIILGFNPNNDEKIFNSINSNENIGSIIIFCEDKIEKQHFKNNLKNKEINFLNFDEWKK